MSKLTRQQLIALGVENYFGNVDRKNMDAVLACCHDDCTVTIQTDHLTHSGMDGIRRMFENLFAGYEEIWHGDFEVTADEQNQTVSMRFNVRLVDAKGQETRLSNCNFFYVEGGKFRRYYVFMSGDNVLR
ncbi:hypothetical protein RHOFW104T7_00295 [Rhodanobacter thiooxydans]|uniref:SnoaL-like domain-containing protein n=1 Tax=Rhodanobacter thiooxydans TaxID=416169 RepID=A0A154QE83_9GAMM|nr:nuclear transport factor 2 family protein [Rhodanobacter thiooxydans]EIL99325.1 hypothetical protein UUA_09966 [Rhodanobacter thiooxydans LCS2]KZC22518.1 hypothetical protein RHOFW104T7_00295 [Rhodanobacter thiooxydans]MCW0202146.1 nuclear transport factor 2 family protein [Rhodanobacter thiooxydans]